MKLWVDDLRPAPEGWQWARSVNEAKEILLDAENRGILVELMDLDHDAGDYAGQGGDYIRLLDWLEETGRSYPLRIHSFNPVGRENMLRIAEKNRWILVK